MKSTEKMVQRHILAYLDQEGYVAWRNQSGMMFTGKYRFQLGPSGSPDIIGMTKTGQFMGIEVKGQGQYQNPNQKVFQKKIEASGGLYILARDVDTVREALEAV